MKKTQSHGRIGEAAAYAKCWMHGIAAYHTSGLRANFAGSDLIVETSDHRRNLSVQVKTGAPIVKDHVYLTQCSGENDLKNDEFRADFVVFVNLDLRAAKTHKHDGSLTFDQMSFYVVPCSVANQIYRQAVSRAAATPKRDGGNRKLQNMAVHAPLQVMQPYRDAWSQIQSLSNGGYEP
jgi:hypothetical protein